MNKQAMGALKRPATKAPKTPTTQAVVAKIQRITAIKGGGQQADWVCRLQSTADKQARTAASAPNPTPNARKATVKSGKSDPAKDNNANQRNPNHDQFYKSRGLPRRPADWGASKAGSTPLPSAG